MNINNLTVGSDPEFFLKDKNNKIISAIGMIGGSKDHPLPISNEGHGLQEDNILVEATIPPCKNEKELIDNINFVKNYITEVICNPRGLELSIQASAYVDKDQLEHPKALEFGCDPDFNAWTNDVNPRPNSNTNLRSAGAHVHFGYDNANEIISLELIKTMDLFLGVPSILLDTDTERRKLYGKAGAFRFKSYGVEYRTLSNFWTKDENSMIWLYNQIQNGVSFLNNGNFLSDEEGKEIRDCINNQDQNLAKNLIQKYKLECVEL